MIASLILAAAAVLAPAQSSTTEARVQKVSEPTMAVALLSCVIQRDGALQGCKVMAESPSEMGVGEAALMMSSQYRLDPLGPDGRLRTGEVVEIPIQIRIK